MDRETMRRKLEPVVAESMAEHEVPGVGVGIILGGVPYAFGFGVTNIDFPLPVDDQTLFQIGSTTKTLTGTVIMQLVEEGLVSLDDKVTAHIPAFRLPDADATREVTVRHLLTHTGGWIGDYFEDLGRGNDALRRIVARLGKHALQETPIGSAWAYNNSGFYVAGRLIEVLTRMPYEQAVTDRLLRPLGMNRSFFFTEQIITYKTALGHTRTPAGYQVARPWGLPRSSTPAGGLTSNVVDQLAYASFHLGDGTAADGTKVLGEDTLRAMQQPVAPAGGMADFVGITWLLDDSYGTRVVKHGGAINGQMSAFALVPDHNFAVTVLTNGDRGQLLNRTVVNWVLAEFLDMHVQVPETHPIEEHEASRYTGRFAFAMGHLVVRYDRGGLTVSVEPAGPEGFPPEIAPLVPPPFRMELARRDLAIIRSAAISSDRLEYVSGADDEVIGVRFGGRISKKLSD